MATPAELDAVYRTQRLRLASVVEAATAAAWAARYRERGHVATDAVLALVYGGQAATVRLVDAYMAAKAESAPKGLPVESYTVGAIRGLPAEDVYERPFGALGAHLGRGEELPAAVAAAQGSLRRLVRTDLQLAHTYSARDWMAEEDGIYGYRRVLGPGKNCPLCTKASSRIYYRDSLMPIHEHCHCTVEPLFGEHPGTVSLGGQGASAARTRVDAAVRVVEDPEIGPRLLEESWAA